MTGQGAERWVPAHGHDGHMGRCGTHSKLLYTSRKGAKSAARRLGGLSVYPCDQPSGGYHIGHLPKIVKDGKIDRADLHSRRSSKL